MRDDDRDDEDGQDDFHEQMLRHLQSNPPPRRRPQRPEPRRESAPPRKALPIPTLMLRHMTEEVALDRLDRFLRQHRRHGTAEVRIIVGKGSRSAGGESVLRPAVRSFCDGRPALVRSIRDAPPELGGGGAWILELTSG